MSKHSNVASILLHNCYTKRYIEAHKIVLTILEMSIKPTCRLIELSNTVNTIKYFKIAKVTDLMLLVVALVVVLAVALAVALVVALVVALHSGLL